MRNTLIVIVKAPLAGRVKTRLASAIGTAEAVRFYRAATATLLRRLGPDPRWDIVLAVDPPRACAATFWPAGIARRPQPRGDLGARMLAAIRAAPHGRVVLIGSDIPAITRAAIADAFAALHRHDAVFGPAEDGGYWLVGLRPGFAPPDLFDNVRWSGPHALSDTRANLSGRSVALARTLFDVDGCADWQRWKRLPLVGAMKHDPENRFPLDGVML